MPFCAILAPMPQVVAKIVVAQAANPAPGGYSYGSRDNLNLASLITLTNLDNNAATSWTWEVFPAVGLVEGDYGVAGKESATCTLTPPASTGYGDLAVRLTVRGDPLPGGRPNVAVDEALLGVRASLTGYASGLPLAHPHESALGGRPTFSALRGVIGRLAESVRGLLLGLLASGAGSGMLYGAGLDGTRTISGTASALTAPVQYTTLALNASAVLPAGGQPIYATTSITLGASAVIHNDGGNGGNGTSGVAGAAGAASTAGQLGASQVTGGAGGTNGQGGHANSNSPTTDSLGGSGGNGGAGGYSAGNGSTAAVPVASSRGRIVLENLLYLTSSGFSLVRGGAGGGGGGGNVTNGGGGGGGGGGGLVLVRCKDLNLATGAQIRANGGNGGTGGGTSSGGGGGGGGGVVVVICDTLTMADSYAQHFKAAGGTAGTGTSGTAVAGSAGHVFVFVGGKLVYST